MDCQKKIFVGICREASEVPKTQESRILLITSENPNKICAVIPFFNEEKQIGSVISKTLNYVDKIICVNDGSTDRSLSKIPDDERIIILNHNQNLGKGRALRTGIEKAIELEFESIVTLDSDNQHDPKLIPEFISALNTNDMVIGARKRDSSEMPIHRRLSNYLTSKLLSIKTGYQIIDSQSGYRAYRTKFTEKLLPNFSGFEAESEMIVKACRNNLKIGFIEIPTIYGNDDSKMKAIPTILGFIKVLLRT